MTQLGTERIRSIEDLHSASLVDSTMANLVAVLKEKIDLSARLPLYAYQADEAGHLETLGLFRELANLERQTIERLITGLSAYLDGEAGLQ
jgi:hypothetical protein